MIVAHMMTANRRFNLSRSGGSPNPDPNKKRDKMSYSKVNKIIVTVFLFIFIVIIVQIGKYSNLSEGYEVEKKVEATAVTLITRMGKSSSSVYGIYEVNGTRVERYLSPVGESYFKPGNKYVLLISDRELGKDPIKDGYIRSKDNYILTFFTVLVLGISTLLIRVIEAPYLT
jgi:hypothetical protein